MKTVSPTIFKDLDAVEQTLFDGIVFPWKTTPLESVHDRIWVDNIYINECKLVSADPGAFREGQPCARCPSGSRQFAAFADYPVAGDEHGDRVGSHRRSHRPGRPQRRPGAPGRRNETRRPAGIRSRASQTLIWKLVPRSSTPRELPFAAGETTARRRPPPSPGSARPPATRPAIRPGRSRRSGKTAGGRRRRP